ncbi:MAG: Multidrug transporter subunit MdtA [Acidobacteriales bacterium]|nr:Multidrug transporter subunit MdtA [Terriglobales bacterium]
MMVRNWIFFVTVVVLSLHIAGCSGNAAPSTQQQGQTGQGGGGRGARGGPGGSGGGGAVPVSAVPVAVQDMPIYFRGLGTVTANNTSVVKSRVDGPLVRINFQEGQDVKEGQVLAEIDPRTFAATVNQAKATLAKDEATLHDAQTNLARFEALAKEGVIAQQQLDTQRSQVGQFEGQIGADKAQIDAASLQLSFTKITAPISGQIGLRKVDVGNIIHAADPNGIAVITQLQPIVVIFSLPEDQLQTTLQAMRKGVLTADAYTRDDKTKIVSGKLLTVDNAIDTTTGTSKFKAVFQNQSRELWPNQFVNVHLLVDVKQGAVTIPSAAIIRGANGSLVYVVKPDSTVEARNVQVGITEGTVAQIDSGLQSGDVVVTDGQDKLQNNAKVTVQPPAGQGGGRGNRQAQGGVDQSGQSGQSAQGNQSGQTTDRSGQTGRQGTTGSGGSGGQTFQRGGPEGTSNGTNASPVTGNQTGRKRQGGTGNR